MRHTIAVLMALVLIGLGTHALADDAELRPWLQDWRDATVALGVIDSKAEIALDGTRQEVNFFKITGTGVIFGVAGDRDPWLVTAKHVFYNKDEGWAPLVIYVRFPWFEDRSVYDYFGIPIKLWDKGKCLWVPHPDGSVDLAAIRLKIDRKETEREKVNAITEPFFVSKRDICDGATVVVLGYPGAVGPLFWSKAVVRSGIIAWAHPKSPADETLLIDAEILPGNSGGPVFTSLQGFDCYGLFKVRGTPRFLGIVSKGGMGTGLLEPASRVKQLLDYLHRQP